MAAASDPIQTITRLTPLAEVLATVDSDVKPVTPRTLDVTAAAGRTLAADAVAPARPSAAMALQDGWALAADDTLGAGGYAPVLLMHTPQRVEAGQPMPAGTDSVAPFDAVKVTDGRAEALVTVNPGDGVLPAGGDSDPGIPLRHAGERLRMTDLAAFACAGLARVTVREPRIRRAAAARQTASSPPPRGWWRATSNAAAAPRGWTTPAAISTARWRRTSADAIVVIGGTGSGRNDASVQTLAREGRLAVHGMALTPGETAALGFVGRGPCCCCRDGSTRRLASGWWSGGACSIALAAAKANEHEPAET